MTFKQSIKGSFNSLTSELENVGVQFHYVIRFLIEMGITWGKVLTK